MELHKAILSKHGEPGDSEQAATDVSDQVVPPRSLKKKLVLAYKVIIGIGCAISISFLIKKYVLRYKKGWSFLFYMKAHFG